MISYIVSDTVSDTVSGIVRKQIAGSRADKWTKKRLK